jgi:hypothetical protein
MVYINLMLVYMVGVILQWDKHGDIQKYNMKLIPKQQAGGSFVSLFADYTPLTV